MGEEFRDIPRTDFAFGSNTYRIFDKPSAGKLVITPSLSSAMGTSVLRGVTFGTYGNALPQKKVEAAVVAYLRTSGRTCTTSAARSLGDPQWEFVYSCEMKYTAGN
jgi:hypothetical protein